MRISCKDFAVHLDSVEEDDAKSIATYSNDREIASNVPNMPFPYTLGHATAFIEFAKARYVEMADYHMAVRLKNGELIGMCAIANIDNSNMRAELGYWIGRKHWGKGYGKMAVVLMLHFAFVTLRLNRISAKVLVGNERSVRLLASLGFREEGLLREDVFHMGRFVDDVQFSLLCGEYSDNPGIGVDGYV